MRLKSTRRNQHGESTLDSQFSTPSQNSNGNEDTHLLEENIFNQMSTQELLSSIVERNQDPVVHQMLSVLSAKISKDSPTLLKLKKDLAA